MAFTAIKYIFNKSNRDVTVENMKTHESTNLIHPGEGSTINTWVEWCVNRNEFNNGHYILVRLSVDPGEDIMFALWQHARSDGDYVRYSRYIEYAVFDDNEPRIPSKSNGARAGGDRVLIVDDEHNIRLEVMGVPVSFAAEVASREIDQADFQHDNIMKHESDAE